MTVEIHHGPLADPYEKQMNAYGYTYGDKAEWVEEIAFGLICAYVQGCMTDAQYDSIMRKFQKKVLCSSEYLKKME